MTELEFHIAEAQHCYNEQQYEKAIEWSLKALALDSANPNAHLIAGLSYYDTDETNKCTEHLEQCLSEVKKNPAMWEKYAVALCMNKRVPEAIEHFKNIITNHPAYNNVWFNYGYSLCDETTANYQAAIHCFDTAEQKGNHSARLYFYRGLCHYNLKQYAQAAVDLKKCFELEPAHANSAYLLGNIHYNTQKWKSAVEYYSRVLYYNPDHRQGLFWRLMARLQIKAKNDILINREAAQADATAMAQSEKPFFAFADKDEKSLRLVRILISEKGELNFEVE